MEDQMEKLFLLFAGISKITTSIEPPAISFTPLAVYREV